MTLTDETVDPTTMPLTGVVVEHHPDEQEAAAAKPSGTHITLSYEQVEALGRDLDDLRDLTCGAKHAMACSRARLSRRMRSTWGISASPASVNDTPPLPRCSTG